MDKYSIPGAYRLGWVHALKHVAEFGTAPKVVDADGWIDWGDNMPLMPVDHIKDFSPPKEEDLEP